MSRDWAAASARMRRFTAVSSATESETSSPSWSSRCTPRSEAVSNWLMKSAVEMSVLEGTQSVSTAAPPTPSRSTTVTVAPRWAATSAAS